MKKQSKHQMDIEKLTVLLPYWLKHNKEHVRDQEIWLEKAQRAGLIKIAEELKKVIDYLKMVNHHIKNANLCIKSNEALPPEERMGARKAPRPSEEEISLQKMRFNFRQIGVIRTPYTDNAPYQPVADDEGDFRIVVNSQYIDGLRYLDRFHYIYVIYYTHRVNKELSMTVRPSWATGTEVGVFASRSPVRPNLMGLSIVRIKKIENNQIVTSGLDVFDRTPLLDIKPYIKELDSKSDANYGWLENFDDRDHLMLHIKGIPHEY